MPDDSSARSRGQLRKARRPIGRHSGMGFQHDSAKLISCLRYVMFLKSRSSLKDSLAIALDAALPEELAKHSKKILLESDMPSKSIISRSQALFDAALTLLWREVCPLNESFLWVWADSSAQASFDIFQSEILVIPRQRVVELFTVSVELANSPYEPPAPTDGDEGSGFTVGLLCFALLCSAQ